MTRALSALREFSRGREILFALLLVAAAVAAALSFGAAVHPEDLHSPRHHVAFADDCRELPALGAIRVRWSGPGDRLRAIQQLQGLGQVAGLTPDAVGRFRRARYLGASPEVVADAVAKLKEGEAPTPPPAPDLAPYYRDGRGPYLCDLEIPPEVTPSAVHEKVPGVELWGEPVAREAESRDAAPIARAESRDAAPIARALLLGLAVLGVWVASRLGFREAQRRILAALGVLVATGLLGAGIDRWSVAALLLVAGAPGGGALLLAAPCLLLPAPALQRAGLILCLGGALRLLLRRPVLEVLPRARETAPAAVLAVVLGALGYLALGAVPVEAATPQPAVSAELGALFVPRKDLAATARRLRAEGLDVTGDARLLPPAPDPARRRDLWRIFTGARLLASRSEGEMRARFEDVADAASQTSLPTLPRELRERLLTRDGRAVLWAPADADRPYLTSARLYRERGERGLRDAARLGGVLVAALGALAIAILGGGVRKVLLRFAGAAAGIALLYWAAPGEADFYAPVVALAAAAPALGPALALAAASLVLPGQLWPAAALLVASAISPRSPRPPTRPSS